LYSYDNGRNKINVSFKIRRYTKVFETTASQTGRLARLPPQKMRFSEAVKNRIGLTEPGIKVPVPSSKLNAGVGYISTVETVRFH
jgi:hypothetical protein